MFLLCHMCRSGPSAVQISLEHTFRCLAFARDAGQNNNKQSKPNTRPACHTPYGVLKLLVTRQIKRGLALNFCVGTMQKFQGLTPKVGPPRFQKVHLKVQNNNHRSLNIKGE